MRLPRDLSGEDLIRRLSILGYRETRQSGSHVRLTTIAMGEHHVTVPRHGLLRTVTLGPRQAMLVPRGAEHRTRAPFRTVVLMIEAATVVPTGD